MIATPVAVFIFNRPDLTAQIFEEIARAQPKKLLVVSDGPRNAQEELLCEEAKEIVSQINWKCEVRTNFSKVNLGCKHRVSSGLDWVFTQENKAIILEDDCLPAPDFFSFCEAMLERYEHDARIMHISGSNFAPLAEAKFSHHLSRYIHIWGWATWRRAWQHYDVQMEHWPQARENILASCADANESRHWDNFFNAVYRGEIDTWDVQWHLACWLQSGLAVLPNVNLISNIGFRADATHTQGTSPYADLPTQSWQDTRSDLPYLMIDQCADALDRQIWITPSLRQIWQRRIKRRVHRVWNWQS